MSHEQIDLLREEKAACEFPEEKLMLMVKYQAFLSIIDALCLSGIHVVVLKGFPLSRKIYGDPLRRITGDIDLLMKPQDVSRAINILSASGYVAAINTWPSTQKKAQRFQRFRNQFAILHPESGIVVELHWRLLYFPVKSHPTLEALVGNNLVEQKADGRSFLVLNDEMELLYLIIHGGLHGWNRLKWLIDVGSLVKQGNFSLEKLRDLAQVLKAQRMIGLYNHFSDKMPDICPRLHVPSTSIKMLGRTAEKMMHSKAETSFHSVVSLFRYFVFIFRAFPGASYKLRLLMFAMRSVFNKAPASSRLFSLKRILAHSWPSKSGNSQKL